MKRRMTVSMVVAMLMVLGITVTAMAAGPGPNAVGEPGTYTAGQGAAINGTFVDENEDGICDSYAVRVPAQDGTGNAWQAGQSIGNNALGNRVQSGNSYGASDGVNGNGIQAQNGSGLGVSNGVAALGTQPQDGTGNQYRKGTGRWN